MRQEISINSMYKYYGGGAIFLFLIYPLIVYSTSYCDLYIFYKEHCFIVKTTDRPMS